MIGPEVRIHILLRRSTTEHIALLRDGSEVTPTQFV